MGMSYDEYWYAEPRLAKDYREAFELKQQMQRHQNWLNGLYSYIAVSTALSNAFREKGKPQAKFPDRPIDEPERKKTDEEIRQEMYESLTRFKETWDAKQHTSIQY